MKFEGCAIADTSSESEIDGFSYDYNLETCKVTLNMNSVRSLQQYKFGSMTQKRSISPDNFDKMSS